MRISLILTIYFPFQQLVKARHREKKRKSKKENENEEQDDFGSDEETYKPDLSWLPDPTQIYERNDDVSDSDDENTTRQVVNSSSDENSESDFEEDEEFEIIKKRRHRSDSDSDQESDVELQAKPSAAKKIKKITSKLTVDDAETFAMQLLSK